VRLSSILLVLSSCAAACRPTQARPPKPEESVPSTAIDILLDPDAAMIERSQAANVRLREVYSAGFALDEAHQPHITCLQRFVRTADLDDVYQAISGVLASENPTTWELKANKYYYIPFGDLGLAGIVIDSTDDLLRFQEKLIDAIEPFTVPTGAKGSFVTTAEDSEINQPTIDYVTSFVPEASGDKFNPHVTIGLGPRQYLDGMIEEEFDTFTFSPASVSVYQLGNLGTAQKKLRGWDLAR